MSICAGERCEDFDATESNWKHIKEVIEYLESEQYWGDGKSAGIGHVWTDDCVVIAAAIKTAAQIEAPEFSADEGYEGA